MLLLVLLVGCGGDNRGAAHQTTRSEVAAPEPTACPPLESGVHRGVCFAHSYQHGGRRGYGSEASRGQLRELRSLGTDWISLTPFGFVRSLESAEVHMLGPGGPGETDARMRRAIRDAKQMGMNVLLKPHLWVQGGAWRADLDPEDGWDAFFRSYEAFLLAYARMAEEEGVAILAVGTELRSSAAHEERWRALIAKVRDVYAGELVYCANWDAAEHVAWWDAVDYVGVQFYPSLAETDAATEDEMRSAIDGHLRQIETLHRRVSRPVLITEVGYKSVRGAAIRPYEWTERMGEVVVDQNAQARAYHVFFSAVAARPWIRGVYVWKWFTDPDSQEEGPGGFSPRGKEAQAVLGQAYR